MWKAGGEKPPAGGDFKRDFKRSEVCLIPLLRSAHETTRDVVGLGDPVERCLASTGRRDRGWDGRKHAMT